MPCCFVSCCFVPRQEPKRLDLQQPRGHGGNLEPSASQARVSERGDFLSGCARSFDGENANDRSRTEASRMVYERSTSEVVREWHLPVFSMQASSFFLNETARNQTKPNETKRNRTERLYERNQTVLLSKTANVLNDNCRFHKRNGTLLEPFFLTHTVLVYMYIHVLYMYMKICSILSRLTQ